MTYTAHGVSLTEGQKQSLAAAVRASRGVTLRLSSSQLTGPDKLMLTSTQVAKIRRAKAASRGVDLKLSKTQLSKQGGLGPFAASMLAGVAAPMIGKLFGFGAGAGMQLPGTGRGMQLPGTRRGRGMQLPGTGRGMQLPGTRRGRGGKKKERGASVDATKALLIKPLSNFDIDSILKDVDNFRGVFSKDMLPQKNT